MAELPRKRFLQPEGTPEGTGVLTSLLRTYIEDHDRSALEAFFGILYDEHLDELAVQVHRMGRASEVTVQEVVDESLARLVQDVIEEKYSKAPDSAGDHLKFMLRRRFIDRRRDGKRRRHEDVADYAEGIPDRHVSTPATEAQHRESEALLDAKLEEALASMPEPSARLIRLRIDGRTHEEMARELGLSPVSIRKAYTRAVEQLLAKLVTHSPSMVLRFQALRERVTTRPKKEVWPSRSAINDALPCLTERVRVAVEKLHFAGVPRPVLEREFGAQTLSVLLRRGYDLLEAQFKVSFPEAFEKATP